MNPLADFKAVIFDMDGLILETEPTYFKAWQQAADKLGFHLSDSFCITLAGLPFSQIEVKLTQYFDASFPFNIFYSLSSDIWRTNVECEGIAVKKGVFDILHVLREHQIPYCLATNSAEINARECLQYAGIERWFTRLICREHVESPKPAPDLFLLAASVLQQPIEDCIVIEDSLTGMLAARRANAFSVLVPSMPDKDGKTQALADLFVNDLSELSVLVQDKISLNSVTIDY